MSKAEAERQYIPLLASHYEAIRQMPREEGNEFLRAIADYGFSGIEPNFTGMMAIVWTAIFPILENNRTLSLSGRRGGQASKRNNPYGRRGKAATDTEKPDGSPEKEPETSPNLKRGAPPTISALRGYIEMNKLNVDPDEFYNYYSSRNWESNGKPIKSVAGLLKKWSEKATAATWPKNESSIFNNLGYGDN